MSRHELDHLRAIVATWLTTDREPVDGAGDVTGLLDADWVWCAEATQHLLVAGLVRHAPGCFPEYALSNIVLPTTRGVYVALTRKSQP